jgi:site-specific recombinase XerD
VTHLPPKNTAILENMLEDFLLSRAALLRAPSTVDFYKRSLLPFVNYLDGQEMTAATVRGFLGTIAKRGVKPGTVHAYGRAIRAWTHFLKAEGYIEQAPHVPFPRIGTPHRPCPSRNEVRRLLAACKRPRDRALVLTLCDTGLRRREACLLEWKDIDLTNGSMTVRSGKGSKARTVFTGFTARRALLRLKREEEGSLVFGLKPSGMRQAIRRLSERAGVKISLHQLRRYFAVESIRAGMDVFSLQRLLGHSTLAMTAIYVRLDTDDLRDAHARSSPADQLTNRRVQGPLS